MEHLWSQAGATGGNRSQIEGPRKRLKQADRQPVATHGNGFGAHGKEDVCHRLPPVADDPLLVREGVDFLASQRDRVPRTRRPAGLRRDFNNFRECGRHLYVGVPDVEAALREAERLGRVRTIGPEWGPAACWLSAISATPRATASASREPHRKVAADRPTLCS